PEPEAGELCLPVLRRHAPRDERACVDRAGGRRVETTARTHGVRARGAATGETPDGGRVAEATALTPSRLRALVEAGIAVTSELTLDAVLQRIVEAAAEITGAPYAALGVIDRSGQGLERFVTTGIEPEVAAEIGHEPHGEGILGVLIRDARPLRLDDITSDPRSVGVPPGHPPMRSFLGVPILLRGVVFGNLSLTEKPGGFTEEDEELVTLLAAQAAVAVG